MARRMTRDVHYSPSVRKYSFKIWNNGNESHVSGGCSTKIRSMSTANNAKNISACSTNKSLYQASACIFKLKKIRTLIFVLARCTNFRRKRMYEGWRLLEFYSIGILRVIMKVLMYKCVMHKGKMVAEGKEGVKVLSESFRWFEFVFLVSTKISRIKYASDFVFLIISLPMKWLGISKIGTW